MPDYKLSPEILAQLQQSNVLSPGIAFELSSSPLANSTVAAAQLEQGRQDLGRLRQEKFGEHADISRAVMSDPSLGPLEARRMRDELVEAQVLDPLQQAGQQVGALQTAFHDARRRDAEAFSIAQRSARASEDIEKKLSIIDRTNLSPAQKQTLATNVEQTAGERYDLADSRVTPAAPAPEPQVAPQQIKTINPAQASTDLGLRTPDGRMQIDLARGAAPGSTERAYGIFRGIVESANKKSAALDRQIGESINREGGIVSELAGQKKAASDEKLGVLQNLETNVLDVDARADRLTSDFLRMDAQSAKDLEALRAQYKDAANINPSRVFGDGMSKRILAIILSAIGGAAAGLTGGPNLALSAINDAIDRDIKAQLANRDGIDKMLEHSRQGRADALTAYKNKLDVLTHERERLQYGATMLLDQLATKYEGTEVGLLARQAHEQMGRSYMQTLQQNDERRSQNVLQAAVADANNALQREQNAIQRGKFVAELSRAGRGRVIPGLVGGELADEKDVEFVKSAKDSRDKIIRAIDELIELRSRQGSESLDRPAIKRMRQLARQIQLIKKDEFGLGALSGSDNEMLEDIITSDPSEWGFVLGQLEGVKKDTNTNFAVTARNHGNFALQEDTFLQRGQVLRTGGSR